MYDHDAVRDDVRGHAHVRRHDRVWSCQPPATADDPDGTYTDANCDGIDGDVTRGVFVAGGGNNVPTCGLTSITPCQTISYGIVRAATAGRNHVFVQAGTYNEAVVLVNGVNVWGGYDFGWQRGPYGDPPHRVTIVGAQDNATAGDGEYLAVRAHDLVVPVTMGDLIIQAPAAVGASGGNGHSSYAVHVEAATAQLRHHMLDLRFLRTLLHHDDHLLAPFASRGFALDAA